MSWLDDLEARATQSAGNAENNIGDWLSKALPDAVVKVGDKALGNQSALEIAQGQKGAPTPVAPGQNASKNVSPYPTLNVGGMVLTVPIMIALAVGIYFFIKK